MRSVREPSSNVPYMRATRALEMRRRKAEARASGQCIVCLKAPARVRRTSCAACGTRAKMHVARMRQRRSLERQQHIHAQKVEIRGLAARQHLAYTEAIAQFEHALQQQTSVEDQARLCRRIGHAFSYTARPDLATPWFERALEHFLSSDETHMLIGAAVVLEFLRSQCALECRTPVSLTYVNQLFRIQEQLTRRLGMNYKKEQLHEWPNLLKVSYLKSLGYYTESLCELSAFTEPPENCPVPQVYYFRMRGNLLAYQGHAEATFQSFEKCIDIAKRFSRGSSITRAWTDYADCAMDLGQVHIAKDCRERALIIARERGMAWGVPHTLLRFAEFFITTGDYSRARNLFAEADTHNTETPLLQVLKATVGVELAVAAGDEALLKRSLRDDVLELAFRSQEPARIGPIAATFVKAAILHRRWQRAKQLISRALTSIPETNPAYYVGELCALAARYGTVHDAAQAKAFLEARTKLPHQRLAQAYLYLWNAYAAQARRIGNETLIFSEKAAAAFARLGWNHQHVAALRLGNKSPALERTKYAQLTDEQSSFRALSSLTRRERQVVEFVLRGDTNRVIAQHLAIHEHTVEKHMSSIMNRLGIRSRHQLLMIAETS